MLRRFRLYRLLRVTLAITWVLPRYIVLIARERSQGRAAPEQAWQRAHAVAAAQFRRLALSLEGAYTKAAQVAGARADILPAPFIDELSLFHDAVPARSLESLRGIVERDLGHNLESLFEWIDPESLAAASLAQVHRAKLKDGSDVVVKIQYPEIRRLMPLDLAMLRRVAGLIHLIQSRVDLRSVITEVARFIELELDFEREVRAMKRLDEILAQTPDVVVPKVHDAYCGGRVIVMEYLDGIQITHTAEIERAGHKLADVARKVGALYGAMIFEHGFFHGDPHPGNLLVLCDGRIGLLDYGLCKELPEGFAADTAQMMVAALIGDSDTAVAAADRLGFETGEIRADHLRSLLLSMIGDSDSDESVFDILGQSRIRKIPEDFALVVRTLILLNGLSHRLAPKRRLIQAELIQHLAAGVERAARGEGVEPSAGGIEPA